MSFPNPPVPDQEYTHSNGITYIYSSAKKAWEIKYEAATNTASLPLANPTGTFLLTGSQSLPDTGGLLTQSHFNEWSFNSLVKVDETSRVDAGEDAPGDADTNQLWYKPSTGSLYVYYNDGSSTQWVEIGGGGAPPEDDCVYVDSQTVRWIDSRYKDVSTLPEANETWLSVSYSTDASPWGAEFQIDAQNNGTWEVTENLDASTKADYGIVGEDSQTLQIAGPAYVYDATIADASTRYPNLKLRCRVYGGVVEYITPEVSPFTAKGETEIADGICDSGATDPGLDALEQRVQENEEQAQEAFNAIGEALDQLEASGLATETYVDNAINSQDFSSYATKTYSDGKDHDLQNQIDDLQVQKGAAANYDCKSNSSNPYNSRVGEIAFNGELSSDVTILGIGADDKSGRPTKSIQQGDIIEIVGPDGSDTRYKVTDPTAAPTYILVNYIAGEQGFALDVQYTVYIYPQNEAGASKDYVDAQDALLLPLTGGTVTGPITGVAPVGELDYATKKFVNDSIGTGSVTQDDLNNYLLKSGGQLTGTLDFKRGSKPSHQFKISPNSQNDYNTNIYSLNNGSMRLRSSHTSDESGHVGSHIILDPNGGTPETRIYHVPIPTQPHMAASKEYVDDAEERLTEQIEQIDLPIVPGDSPVRPPGLRFRYESGSGSSVTTGKFKWYDSSGRRLRISASSYDFPWGTDSPTGDITYSEAHLFHIYATVTDNNTGQERWRIKTTGSFNRIDWHTNDILLYVPYHLMNGSFSETAMYYITISGLF